VTPSTWKPGAIAIDRLADDGLDVAGFRTESLRLLRTLLSIDAAFYATVDPATMLFTSASAEGPLAAVAPQFLDNEFGRSDVNKFANLARSTDPVGSLDAATEGDRPSSARYREVISPLGLGDELRIALRSGGRCWGVLCLHREQGALGFAEPELDLLRRLGPHLAEGLRRGIALYPAVPDGSPGGGPGIVILGSDLSVISINAQAEHWLASLDTTDWDARSELPLSIYAAAAHAARPEVEQDAPPPASRIRRAGGGWVSVHASRLKGEDSGRVAVILDAANSSQLSSLVLAAHGLTPAQNRVAALVIQGRSTGSIVDELHISSHTVQEHLRAVFDKFGIGSRRELVEAVSGRPH
jgi:DNA-binding CsgD family transcriptional regulator